MEIGTNVVVVDRRGDNSRAPAIVRGPGEMPGTYNLTVWPNTGPETIRAGGVRIGDENSEIRQGERFVILKSATGAPEVIPSHQPEQQSADSAPKPKRGRPAKAESAAE